MHDEALWQSVLSRDTSARFYYAVQTTGVYCRPSCPSRRPHRAHVRFFDSLDLAEAAGFRACRRCHPKEEEPKAALVRDVCRFLEAHFQEPLSLSALGTRFGVSASHLQRTFRRATGVSPRQYQETLRMNAARELLREGEPVSAAAYEAGFGAPSRFYSKSNPHLGMTPARYRKGGAHVPVRFTLSPCRLGWLLVASTPQGLCSVTLSDTPEEAEAALRRELPRAEIAQDDPSHAPAVQAVLDYLEGNRSHLDLPLDVQATAFQRRVWDALGKIPPGETRTYSEVAALLGQPSAARAVAQACATNPVALVVPCHRVVRSDGSLSGYRWGVERKLRLLEAERKGTA